MGIFSIFQRKKESPVVVKREEAVITVEPPRQPARVIPLFNPNQEFEDLEKNHADFFATLSPREQLQPNVGRSSTNFEATPMSRSEKFFHEAPSVQLRKPIDEDESFRDLENYMHIPHAESVEEEA